MQKYSKIIQELLQYFNSVNFQQIPRAKNVEADFLARLASLNDHGQSLELCMETRGQPSTEGEQVPTVQKQGDWMTPIVHFLKEGRLLVNKTEARNVQIRAAHFIIIDDVLYKRGHSLPFFDVLTRKNTARDT